MKEQIRNQLDRPAELEKLYRKDRSGFKRAFNSLYPEIGDQQLASYWNERLNYAEPEQEWGSRNDFIFAIVASLLAGIVAKLPTMFDWKADFFYQRNIGFIVFPFLAAYFIRKNKIPVSKLVIPVIVMLAGLVFINLLPENQQSNTFILSSIHLPIVLWFILSFTFVAQHAEPLKQRLNFLKYNGDLVVMSALILIAGGIMSAITIGLFNVIGLNIEKFYFENIVVFGLAAVPIVGTYLTQVNPQLVGKVSPVIAKIFSPLVLVMLVVYLIAMPFGGKDPYNDREFLLIFNLLLIGVMAIIFFSVAGINQLSRRSWEVWVLFFLAITTIVVNGIALSAIVFRIAEWGITPNRLAVLGSNLCILVHLILVSLQLFGVISRRTDAGKIGRIIAIYLPVYAVWAIIVTFLFPLLFNFR